jgi:flavin reductase (DIM6/NTAB) family NADH-FMN oxidoreductase RutF
MKDEIPIEKYNRLINHSPVLLVTTIKRGKPNVMAMAWYSPLSKNPPLIGVILDQKNYTHRLVEGSGELVLNLPHRDLIREVYFCGSISGREVDKFAETGLNAEASHIVKPPLVTECIAHIECEVEELNVAGDHTIFVVKPRLCLAEKSLFDETWDTSIPSASGIHHLGGPFFLSDGPRVEVDLNERVVWKDH